MSLQPIHARGFIDLRQPAAHRVLAHHLAHAEQGRVHRVTAQRRDVRIALMTGENRQQQRAEHVALARRIRTGERQRAVRHPAVEQATLLQVFEEKRQLTERRHRLRSIPLDVHPTAERVGNRRPFLYLRLLTRRVSRATAKSIVISRLSADSAEARKVQLQHLGLTNRPGSIRGTIPAAAPGSRSAIRSATSWPAAGEVWIPYPPWPTHQKKPGCCRFQPKAR